MDYESSYQFKILSKQFKNKRNFSTVNTQTKLIFKLIFIIGHEALWNNTSRKF